MLSLRAKEKAIEICKDQLKRNFINEEDYKDYTDPAIKYQFRTITTPIKGMYNIMNEV